MKRTLLTVLSLLTCGLVLSATGSAGLVQSFTEQVSPSSETNATEPSVAVDRSDGTVYVAWQASGTRVARSDIGGRSFVQTPIVDLFGSDVGDMDVRVGGPTPCAIATANCLPATHREVILMRFIDAMSLEEIATALDIPLGTVKSRLAWARQRLRTRLARRGLALSAGMLSANAVVSAALGDLMRTARILCSWIVVSPRQHRS